MVPGFFWGEKNYWNGFEFFRAPEVATTDDDGRFNIAEVEDGNYKLSISFIGFEDYKENVAIEGGKTYKIDARLFVQPIAMTRLEIISDATAPYQKLPGAATPFFVCSVPFIGKVSIYRTELSVIATSQLLTRHRISTEFFGKL